MAYVGTIKRKGVGYGHIDCFETNEQYYRDVFYSRKTMAEGLWRNLDAAVIVRFDVEEDAEGLPTAVNIVPDPQAVPTPTHWNQSDAVEEWVGIRGKGGPYVKGKGKGKPKAYGPDGEPLQELSDMTGFWMPEVQMKGKGNSTQGTKRAHELNPLMNETDGHGRLYHLENKLAKIENPGLNDELRSFDGNMKAHFNPHTGFTFVLCDEIRNTYGKDAYLHARNCPWVDTMRLLKDDPVTFQIVEKDGSPQVVRIMRNGEGQEVEKKQGRPVPPPAKAAQMGKGGSRGPSLIKPQDGPQLVGPSAGYSDGPSLFDL